MRMHLSMKNKINAISVCLLVAAFSIYTIVILISKYNENEKANHALIQSHLDAIFLSLNVDKEAKEAAKIPVELNDQTINNLKNKYSTRVYMKTGYFSLFGANGLSYIHPTEEGKNISKLFYCAKILSEQNSEGNFEFTEESTRINKIVFYKLYKPYDVYVSIIMDKSDFMRSFYSFATFLVIATIVLLLSLIYFSSTIATYFSGKFGETETIVNNIYAGNYSHLYTGNYREAEVINAKLSMFYSLMKSISDFAKELSQGNMNAKLSVENPNDKLSQYLQAIQNNIKETKEAEDKRKVQDEKQNWVNQGLARFSELLRIHTDTIEAHCDIIIQNLVHYVNANQGGIYLIDKTAKEKDQINLISAFAFDSKKFLKRRYMEGEGLLGTCVQEKQTIYLTDVPDNYIEITSGLGFANPRSILISPIINEEEVLGIVELASFNRFEEHEIKFVEKILESVAATLKTAKINAQTNELIHKFEMQKKEMADNEEMMQQNIEEFKAAQEESESKETIYYNYIKSLSETQIMVEYSESGQVLQANENFVNLVGRENKQLIFTTLKDHQHLRLLIVKDIAQLLDDMHNNKRIETVNRYDFRSGILWLKESFIPVKNAQNKLEKIIRLCVDVSAQRVLEEKNQDLQSQLENITSVNEDLLKAINEKEKYCNELIEQIKQNPPQA